MSKPRGMLESVTKVVLLVFLAFVGFVFTQSLFMIFFVPVVIYYVWWNYDRTRELERRLSELEKPSEQKPGQS